MNASGLSVRTWNDAPITRRDSDGFADATAMCQANGKEWYGYIRNERTTAYLQALADSLGIPADQLVITTTTGRNHLRGTWIHPRLAVDLARWLCPAFAVWMDGWLLETMAAPAALPARQPGFTPDDAFEAIELACASFAPATETLMANAGWPGPGAIDRASEALEVFRRRLEMVERLLPLAHKRFGDAVPKARPKAKA
jgi:hypothetical protein